VSCILFGRGQTLDKEDFSYSASDFRHGVEEKSWLAQAEQARLYFNQAQDALETVKVLCMIPALVQDANKLSVFPSEMCRRSNQNSMPERTHGHIVFVIVAQSRVL